MLNCIELFINLNSGKSISEYKSSLPDIQYTVQSNFKQKTWCVPNVKIIGEPSGAEKISKKEE